MNLETITIDRITDLLLSEEVNVKEDWKNEIWSNRELDSLFMQNGYFSFPQFQMTHSERRESVLIALLTLNDSRFLKILSKSFCTDFEFRSNK